MRLMIDEGGLPEGVRCDSDGVNEQDYLTLSGVQHYAFCPRQWALIFIEQQWADNVRTDGWKSCFIAARTMRT